MYGMGFPANWQAAPRPTPERKLVVEATLVFCSQCGCHYLDGCDKTGHSTKPVRVKK